MTEFTITNNILTARVNTKGAELRSIIYEGEEYIWQAGQQWSRSAPVCCPWCGVLEGDNFIHNGVTYPAPRHGFVRDALHTLTEKGDDSLTLAFTLANGDKRWSWPFALSVDYKLQANTLIVAYKIVNTGSEVMPLQFGFHPGFIAPKGSIIRAEKNELSGGVNALPVKRGTFDNDSICLEKPKSDWFALDRPDGRSVTLDTHSFNYVLLWGVPGDTPFVCIEPWTGYIGDGILFDRPGTTPLAPSKEFNCELKITFK